MTQTPAESYDVATDVGKVRLLLSDVAAPWVFTDAELTAFLSLEGGVVKLAAAQAIDTHATNEALASKVLKDREVTTDGAKLADSMRRHAAALRAQAAAEQDQGDGGFFFAITPGAGPIWGGPELTERQPPAGFW